MRRLGQAILVVLVVLGTVAVAGGAAARKPPGRVHVGTPYRPPAQTNTGGICGSKLQIDPEFVDVTLVPGFFAMGYWAPFALPGNVVGGTNVGSYHLVCNLATGQAVTGSYVDHDGQTQDPVYSGTPGIYPLAG